MTQTSPPAGDEPGVEQQPSWDGSTIGSTAPHGNGDGASARGAGVSSSITESLTSTSRKPGPAGLFHADVPNRIMALILDVIALVAIGFVLSLLFGGLETPQGATDSAGGELDVGAFLIVLIVMLVVSFGYFVYLWKATRSTIGMRVLGSRLGDEADGGEIAWRQAVIRWSLLGIASVLVSLPLYVPGVIVLLLGIVGFLWLLLLLYTVAKSETSQGLHDRYARTIVVRARRRTG